MCVHRTHVSQVTSFFLNYKCCTYVTKEDCPSDGKLGIEASLENQGKPETGAPVTGVWGLRLSLAMSFSLFDPESPGFRTGAGHQWPSAPGSNYIHIFLCSWPFCPVPCKVDKRTQRHGIQNQRVPTPWHSGKGKTLDTVKRSMVDRSWWEGWMNGWNTEDFSDSEATFCCSVAKSHPILCNSMDCNPPGSSVLHYLLSLLKFMSI